MHENRLVLDILKQIETAINTIKLRFSVVDSLDYLIDTPQGQEKLDSICMLLIAIGESLKKIDKLTNNNLLNKYENIDWKAIKRMRYIITPLF